ncbi:hypothetical protein MKW98_028962 [Papaver atlanticum]|uniref:Late embryogenesis abundant protein LEA-2 subgroup domain-containing protein n=1 Tax=Papaver atlanticum TaxID=357466 RepID=A0AAD4XZ24_9MAGN|nr:hypothetical protein MKW98_028962 [Papaver atlanticum]
MLIHTAFLHNVSTLYVDPLTKSSYLGLTSNNGDLCFRCYVILTFTIFVGGVACLTIFIDFVPYQHMKFYVNDASLTEFYLTNDDVLHYNLAVNISVRNSNKMERISYSSIRSKTSCYGKYLALVPLLSFRQGTKSTAFLHPVLQGQTLLKLRGSYLKDFNHDQMDGSYTINVDLYLRTQLKHAGGGKGPKIDYRVKCGLFRVQLFGSPSSNNPEQIGGSFKTKRCETYQ